MNRISRIPVHLANPVILSNIGQDEHDYQD